MACLNDVEIQALADGEGTPEQLAHANACARCAARLAERRRFMAELTTAANPVDVPSAALASRVRESMRAHAPAQGATVLQPVRRPGRKPIWASLAGAAAVAAIVIVVVLPRVGAPQTLSAAQIIDRSLVQMTGGSGVELLEYDLVLSSDYRRRAGLPEGPYRIVQLFDRSNPARFKFAQFDANNVLVAATSQDPAHAQRTELQRVDGRNFIVRVRSLPAPMLPLPQLLQSQAEAALRMLQVNADQHLSVLDDASGKHYVIALSDLAAASPGTPMALDHARVDIDGRDFRVREFSASGMLLGMPFEVSFTLINQIKAADVAASDWEIPQGPGDVVIEGDGQGEIGDSMTVLLRAFAEMQGR